MLKISFNGRSLRAGELGVAFREHILEAVQEELHARIASIRHPDSGEFPIVRVVGTKPDDVHVFVEGSPELIAFVQRNLNDQDREAVTFMNVDRSGPPRAFLSYSFDDRELAGRIARGLMEGGIDTWWAEWEIRAGDSLRQRIDEGLSRCTHFIVLLTPGAMQKAWVKQEMDAGLVRKISGKARFIPLRAGVSASDLSALISGLLSPAIDDAFDTSIRDLVNDIHGISRKPVLGMPPTSTELPAAENSPIAVAIAKIFVEQSEDALDLDCQENIATLSEKICASEDDIQDALFELRAVVQEYFGDILAKAELYAEYDGFFMDWSPAKDAARLAADLLNDKSMPTSPLEIAAHYNWSARRLNPAITWLASRKLIRTSDAMGTQPWVTAWIDKTDATRRFVKGLA